MAACSMTAWLVTRRVDGATQVFPALRRVVAEAEGGALEAAVDQMVVERALVLEVDG